MSSDLRIYYGNARIIIEAGDERISRILAMVVKEVKDHEVSGVIAHDGTIPCPRNDNEAMAMLRAYILKAHGLQ